MNSQHAFGGLLLSSLFAAGLAAQEMTLDLAVRDGQLVAEVGRARPGDLAIVVLGFELGQVELPGGQLLGVDPALVTGFVVADGPNLGFRVPLPGFSRGGTCYGQAVAVSPRLPLDDPAAIRLSGIDGITLPTTDTGGRR
ncbi:MAG: hypothetical protein KF830_16170 [Planctomycetes bacterium]|nr:hypothetical protein [Planctomycetota bacterium]